MHFRRMDPQPAPAFCPSDPIWFDVPIDMPGAKLWRDRDGTWYWRRQLSCR